MTKNLIHQDRNIVLRILYRIFFQHYYWFLRQFYSDKKALYKYTYLYKYINFRIYTYILRIQIIDTRLNEAATLCMHRIKK